MVKDLDFKNPPLATRSSSAALWKVFHGVSKYYMSILSNITSIHTMYRVGKIHTPTFSFFRKKKCFFFFGFLISQKILWNDYYSIKTVIFFFEKNYDNCIFKYFSKFKISTFLTKIMDFELLLPFQRIFWEVETTA